MKKIIIYISLALIVIIVGVVLISLSNPLRKSNDEVRVNMLELTPIGTSMDEVLRLIESKEKWKTVWINDENEHDHTDLSGDFIIGKKSIRASIGKYRNFFKVDVQIYWGFDKNSKLIEIGVRKDADTF